MTIWAGKHYSKSSQRWKRHINGFNLAYKINDYLSPIVQYFDNKVIPYGDSVTVSFKAMADLSKYGNIRSLLTD